MVTTYDPTAVGSLIGDPVVRVAPDATLHVVADSFVANDIGAVVVGLGHPQGIVTERDVVRALAERRDPDVTVAMDVATTALVWCDAGASVDEAAEEMMENYVRHLLVETDGELVGIVSARDIIGVRAAPSE